MTVDTCNESLYTKDELEEVAKMTASAVVQELLHSNVNLDNSIQEIVSVPERTNDMARIKQRVVLPNGQTVWCTGDTIGDAITNLMSHISINNSPPKRTTPTLQEYGDKWYRLYHVKKVKWNTAQNTRIYLDKHIYPLIGEKHLDEITFDDIQSVFNSMDNLARSTVEKVQIVLNQIMKNAIEDGYIEKNVMSSSRYVLSKKVKQREALSVSSAQDVIQQLNALEPNDKVLMALIIFTGLRRGEILALTWEDIDFENKVIHVKHSVTFKNNQPIICGTKSKSGVRDVPIIKELKEILDVEEEKHGYIIKNHKLPDVPITEKTYQRAWERIKKTINLHNATAHVFRHTFATMMEPHTDIKTLQTIMGHADIQTTMNRYTHKIDKNIQALAEIDSFV